MLILKLIKNQIHVTIIDNNIQNNLKNDLIEDNKKYLFKL